MGKGERVPEKPQINVTRWVAVEYNESDVEEITKRVFRSDEFDFTDLSGKRVDMEDEIADAD